MKSIIMAIAMFTSVAFATPTDTILLKGPTKSIHLMQTDDYNLYQLCTENDDLGMTCQRLGSATNEELAKIAEKELTQAKWKVWTTVPATIGTTVVLGVFSFFYLGMGIYNPGDAKIGLAYLAATLGVATLPVWLKPLNPWVQFKEASIFDDVAGEAISEVSDRVVIKNANILQSVLN